MNRAHVLMQMLNFNEAMDQMAMAKSELVLLCTNEQGWSNLEHGMIV